MPAFLPKAILGHLFYTIHFVTVCVLTGQCYTHSGLLLMPVPNCLNTCMSSCCAIISCFIILYWETIHFAIMYYIHVFLGIGSFAVMDR